jgi:hypothetical protein
MTAIKIIAAIMLPLIVMAGMPSTMTYQGRVVDNGTNFNGTGYFKFSLIDSNGVSYWSNDGQLVPSASIVLSVNRGLFSVQLGDTNSGMPALSSSVFTNSLWLRMWFSSGGSFHQMSPDQTLGVVPYSMIAGQLNDGTDIRVNSYSVIPLFAVLDSTGTIPSGSYLQVSGFKDMQVVSNFSQIGICNAGKELTLQGTSNTNRILLTSGNGLKLEHGINFCLGRFDTITFIFDNVSTNWVEVSRKNNSQ